MSQNEPKEQEVSMAFGCFGVFLYSQKTGPENRENSLTPKMAFMHNKEKGQQVLDYDVK